MKKYFLLLIVSVFTFFACETPTKEINDALIKNVTDAETVVNYHDSIVQSALENHLYDSIPKLTKEATLFLSKKIAAIHVLKAPTVAENYKSAAVQYVESLMGVIKAQDLYSNYTDTITEQEIETLDNLNVEAVNNAEIQHTKFLEYKKAFSKSNGL